MTLPTPLRTARAIALFQGWAAGLGVFVMLGVAVLAAGGLRNGAFVALALLFLAGDVLAVSVAVVIAARRLAEGAAWARLLLDVVEGVTIAVGLLAILLGTGILGFLGVVLGVTVIVCLHTPTSNAMFAGQPILPWEVAARQEPQLPAFPVPSLPPRRRSGIARPMTATPAPPAAPSARRPVTPPAWEPSPAPGARRYSWERSPTPLPPPARVPRPADLPSAADRSIPPIEPLPPLAPPEAPLPLMTPPVVPPPDEPPGRPFVVPPLEKLAEVPRHATPPPPDPSEGSGVRPFVVPSPEEPPVASDDEWKAPPAAEPPAAPVPPPIPAVPPAASAPSTLGPLWEPRRLPPSVAAAAATPVAPRSGSATVYERRSRSSARPARPAARSGMPPAPSWAWRRVVIAASLLGAIGGGTLSAIELIAGGGSRLPATGQAPAPQPPRSGALPGLTIPAPARPRTERSEPAAAGGVSAVTVTPEGACVAGSSCTVTVRVDLEPHPDEMVAWTLVIVDRCSSQRSETPVTGVSAPASYRYVMSTNQVTVPAWRSPQVIAVTTSPARASSQPIVLGGAPGC